MHFCHHGSAYKWAELNIKIGAVSDILIKFAVFSFVGEKKYEGAKGCEKIDLYLRSVYQFNEK